jgi:hypothetical protein
MVTNYKTINEIRADKGLDPLPHGDIVLNSTYTSNIQMAGQMGGDEEDFDENPILAEEENPIEKSLNEYLKKLS